jgi:oligoendopeptidase F
MNWDLSDFFTSFESVERRHFTEQLSADIAACAAKAQALAGLASDNQSEWEQIFLEYEALIGRLSHVASYVGALASCDSQNEAYRQEEAQLAVLYAAFEKLGVQLKRALRSAADNQFASFQARESLAGAGFFLQRLREQARYSMATELEELAADLATDGLDGWSRLYDVLSGTLSFEMRYPDGRSERLPMSARRSLLSDSDRNVRRAAFAGGNEAWQSVADTAAAALNHIAGTRHTLYARRNIEHFLDAALFDAAISKRSLDAMMQAVLSHAEVPRRFLRLKARTLGLSEISWYDLEAPLPLPSDGRIDWPLAKSTVGAAFGRAYPELARYFEQVIDRNWVEWEPRTGKRPGAFCTGSELINQSRIFMTFQGSLGDVSTLAHEVGHGFHNHAMRDLRIFARHYPMTLAECASTFAEMLLNDGMLADPRTTDAERAQLLAHTLSDGTIFLLDIPVRYEFEKSFYEERHKTELSVSRLKALMEETQHRIFGDCLAEDGVDPYFWASKLHFYISGVSFYNFPYTFGYLLSRSLYLEFKRQGPSFLPRYEAFLRRTGSGPAEDVAKQALGWDLESPEFWARAIESLDEPMQQLSALLPKLLPDVSVQRL